MFEEDAAMEAREIEVGCTLVCTTSGMRLFSETWVVPKTDSQEA
jgi:hypothetical protein